MRPFLVSTSLALGLLAASLLSRAHAQDAPALRPPSVPLVAHDPYFSIWSPADALHAKDTVHWTGKPHTLSSLVRIDGKAFRIMGADPASVEALPQKRVEVLPTRTIYELANAQIAVTLTFTTPALPAEIDVLSRPVTYVTFEVRSADGAPHEVQLYFDASAGIAVNEPAQKVKWERADTATLTALRIGSEAQPVLKKKGDDLRIDWGHLYLAAPKISGAQSKFASRKAAQEAWTASGKLPAGDDARMPRPANDEDPVAVMTFDLGKVTTSVSAFDGQKVVLGGLVREDGQKVEGVQKAGHDPFSRTLLIAYDDEFSATFMGRKLRPYWRRAGMDAANLLDTAASEFLAIQKRCVAFDDELMADLGKVGGEKFARIAALAHRQALAANKVVADANGAPLMFSKENFSNGCMGTVDVLYPAAPQLLLLSPTLAKASLHPILSYGSSERWKFPFAPHDLGTYPRADGQVYGGGERTEANQMPVEESGNMLILIAAVAKIEGNAKFAEPFWPRITAWAQYLESKGFDPENQLCTDDFAGHLAHNVNLSAKAIEALGAYALLCEMGGDKAEAARVHKVAKEMAARWVREAKDGEHYRLAFDRAGSWSQKYNLVWDEILGIKLFPAEVMKQEMAFYRTKLNRYGLPLDNRKDYTKLDWTIWTAILTGDRADFDALVAPVFDFLNDVPQRNPMTDWYETKVAKQVGFQARSVVGGVFIPLLGDAAIWKKWAQRDLAANPAQQIKWAPLPTPPKVTEVVPTSQKASVTWHYTFDKPADGWMKPDFDDSGWRRAPGGFGTAETPGTDVRTEWKTPDIWLRREFTLPAGATGDLQLLVYHDEDAEVFLNGVPAASFEGFDTTYITSAISPAARATLKAGKNTLAVRCHQTGGGQFIDVGLARVEE